MLSPTHWHACTHSPQPEHLSLAKLKCTLIYANNNHITYTIFRRCFCLKWCTSMEISKEEVKGNSTLQTYSCLGGSNTNFTTKVLNINKNINSINVMRIAQTLLLFPISSWMSLFHWRRFIRCQWCVQVADWLHVKHNVDISGLWRESLLRAKNAWSQSQTEHKP